MKLALQILAVVLLGIALAMICADDAEHDPYHEVTR